ncbi:hypothetical protein NPIL_247041 [Nephila pilipes]|uniref:Uncharacterized protein n=1 Tax=Nephila pilipes TaxID=299642 RepID=A0A8X6U1H8_NEPPI|nr:hypothetical protein NPIL_247041 [Nephila pilipes]
MDTLWRYISAPNALEEASEKPHKTMDVTLLCKMNLGILINSRSDQEDQGGSKYGRYLREYLSLREAAISAHGDFLGESICRASP